MARHVANVDSSVQRTKEGALLPDRDIDDWTDEEMALAARRPPLGEVDLDGAVQGEVAETDDDRCWEVAPSTLRCNSDASVRIRGPHHDEWVVCEPLHFMHTWTRNNNRRLFAVEGVRNVYPMVAAMKRLTTGAGTRGYRAVYIGPYCGERSLLPVSMDD